MADLFHDPRPRIIVFVNRMAEPHQAEGGFSVLRLFDVFADIAFILLDEFQHLDDRLIGAAMIGAPERRNARGNRGV